MATPSLDELIAGARSAKRAHRDVDVTLDQAVAEQVEAIDERIEQTEQDVLAMLDELAADLGELQRDGRLADPRPEQTRADREARIAELRAQAEALFAERQALTEGTLVTFRFTQLPGQAWAEIGARNPARPDVQIDRVYGYNYHEVAKAAAVYRDPGKDGRGYAARVLPADDPEVEPAVEPVTPEQMTALFEVLSGHEFERIASALWDLNDYGPQQRIAAAGKASRVGSVARSSSPAASESHPDDSAAGNPDE